MNNILEEYLVKIGALADARSFQNAQNLVNGLSGSLQTLGKVLRFGGIMGMFAGLVKGIADQIKSVAALDMQYQKLAKDMWVTKETAKQLTVIKDVMKATENDIAFIPELREQFVRLRAEMQALATPPDAADQFKWVRSIGYEVESLQVKLQMFREWLVYYLIKYLGPYIKQFQEFLQWLNSQFADKIAIWANKLAYILARIVVLIMSAGRAVKWLVGGLWNFFDSLPEKTKKMVMLFSAAGAAIMMSPFGMMLVAIGGALILLEDFFGYIDGKKSSRTMAPVWAAIIKFANGTGKSILDMIKQGLNDIVDILSKAIKELKITEVISTVAEGIGEIAGGLFEVAKGIGAVLQKLNIGKPSVESFFGGFAEHVSDTIKGISKLAGSVGKVFKAVGLALQGDWSGAWDTLKDAYSIYSDGFGAVKRKVSGFYNGLYNSVFGNGGGAGANNTIDRAKSIVDNPTSDFIGNNNGCTYFVSQALGNDNAFMQAVGAASGGLWVPNWVAKAKEMGLYHEGVSGMKRGDIVVFDYPSDPTQGDGDHVVIYDGQGGAYGNSSQGTNSRPKYYADVNSIGPIMGYIDMGGATSGGSNAPGGGSNSFGDMFTFKGGLGGSSGATSGFGGLFNSNSYAAGGAGAYAMPGVGSVVNGDNTNYNFGNIYIYTNDARQAGQALFDEVKKRQGSGGTIK